MNLRKISLILVITMVASFITALITRESRSVGLDITMDLCLALSLWTYTISFLAREKNKLLYIKSAIAVSILSIIVMIMVIMGYDFSIGKSI